MSDAGGSEEGGRTGEHAERARGRRRRLAAHLYRWTRDQPRTPRRTRPQKLNSFVSEIRFTTPPGIVLALAATGFAAPVSSTADATNTEAHIIAPGRARRSARSRPARGVVCDEIQIEPRRARVVQHIGLARQRDDAPFARFSGRARDDEHRRLTFFTARSSQHLNTAGATAHSRPLRSAVISPSVSSSAARARRTAPALTGERTPDQNTSTRRSSRSLHAAQSGSLWRERRPSKTLSAHSRSSASFTRRRRGEVVRLGALLETMMRRRSASRWRAFRTNDHGLHLLRIDFLKGGTRWRSEAVAHGLHGVERDHSSFAIDLEGPCFFVGPAVIGLLKGSWG